jgi:pimeloyl-ACP methyl ester carboxylesterase
MLSSAGDGTCKTLLAAHIALTRPDRLSMAGDVDGVPVGELRELVDQLARYLAWLGALQLTSSLDWLVPVAADLSQRFQYRRARPSRGSGRMLRLLAATSRSKIPDRYTADTLLRLWAAGIHAPEQVDPECCCAPSGTASVCSQPTIAWAHCSQ